MSLGPIILASLASLIVAGWIIRDVALKSAPEGFEDDDGFHYAVPKVADESGNTRHHPFGANVPAPLDGAKPVANSSR